MIYQIYIECELYNLAYNKNSVVLYEHEFVRSTMVNWDDHNKFTKMFSDRGILIYIKL